MLVTRTLSQTHISSGFARNKFVINPYEKGALSKLMEELNIFAKPAMPVKTYIKNADSFININTTANSVTTSMLKKSLYTKQNFATQLVSSLFSYNRDSTNASGYLSKGSFVNILG